MSVFSSPISTCPARAHVVEPVRVLLVGEPLSSLKWTPMMTLDPESLHSPRSSELVEVFLVSPCRLCNRARFGSVTIRFGCGFFHLKYVGKPPPRTNDARLTHDLDRIFLLNALTSVRVLQLRHSPQPPSIALTRCLLLQTLHFLHKVYLWRLCVASASRYVCYTRINHEVDQQTATLLLVIGVYMLFTWTTRLYTWYANDKRRHTPRSYAGSDLSLAAGGYLTYLGIQGPAGPPARASKNS